jgi:hypothetical protein
VIIRLYQAGFVTSSKYDAELRMTRSANDGFAKYELSTKHIQTVAAGV